MQPTAPRSPSASVALHWLRRQLAWESTLNELRDTTPSAVTHHADDEAAA